IKSALVSLRQRVRVYTPYGQLIPGMAYLVRRLLENTSDDSFLRASFTENVPEEQLLMNPLKKRSQGAGGRRQPEHGNGRALTPDPGPLTPIRNEPPTDFSKEEARQAMQAALDEVKGQLGRTYPLVINGREVTPPEAVDSVNPSHSRQVVGRWGKA